MFDKELVKEIFNQILLAGERILKRFEPIKSPSDFYHSEEGIEKMDGICMQLIAIGESLKNIDKITDKKLLSNYPEIDWKSIKGIRDVISHNYFDLNAEAIFDVCKKDISLLIENVKKIIHDLK